MQSKRRFQTAGLQPIIYTMLKTLTILKHHKMNDFQAFKTKGKLDPLTFHHQRHKQHKFL